MTKKQLSVLIASLFVAAPAFAQSDEFRVQGAVSAGGIYTDVGGDTKDASKLNEYQDLSNGMLSTIEMKGRNSKSWLNIFGENFGRDDLYVDIRGGMYDTFKARGYTNWMPHNFLFNGLTPYNGNGGAALQATFPQPNSGLWNVTDIGYQRKDTGGYFEWQRNSPWYARIDGNQVTTNGTKIGAASNGMSPGNGYVDLAFPVEYTTNNVTFEGGYTSKTMTLTASYLVSNFGNKNETLNWTNPFFGGNLVDTTYLAPDNNYQRFALNGTLRSGFWNSTFSARYTWDQTTSESSVPKFALNTGPSYIDLKPEEDTFNGEETRQTFTLGWAATPLAGLDTRAYYNYQKMDNGSTLVEFCKSGASTCGGYFENELWEYTKNNFGIDAYYRLGRSNRLGGGWDYNKLEQNRPDFDNTETNTFWVEWKNTSFETVTARIKYSYIDRHSDDLWANSGVNANDPLYLERFTKFFDLADLKQNKVKVWFDWTPSDNMGVGLEYIYKDNDYSQTVLGRTGDTRNEVFANFTWGRANSWRLNLFGDYESVNYDSQHRYISNPVCATPNCNDPNTPPTSTAYNWNSTVKNDNWLIGVGGEMPWGEKLMFTGSFMYEKTDGSADMASQNNYGNPLPLNAYPNTKMYSLNLKGTYKIDKNWSLSGGYAYQKYDNTDDQFSGYVYSLPSINPSTGVNTESSRSYLNGWNAFNNYDANIFWLTLKFAWDAPALAQAPAAKVAEAPKPVVAPPPPPPAPAPAPAPAPQVQRITLDSKALFDFDKAVLKPEGQAAIDSMVVAKLNQMQKLEVVVVTGHTDRIGSEAYNLKLSQRRADAVRDYLVSKGVDKAKVETIAMGLKQPVVQCDQKNRKELIACLQPNRRVEVQAKGEAKK